MLAWSAVTFTAGLFPGSSMHQITRLQTVLFSCLRLIVVLNNPPVKPHQGTIDHNTFQLNCFLLSGRKQSHDEPEPHPAADLWWRIFPGKLKFHSQGAHCAAAVSSKSETHNNRCDFMPLCERHSRF